MKKLLMISAMFLAFQAQAEIFKCKNENGKITYQGTPCFTGTVGKIKKAPDVPIEEQIRAQARTDNMIEMNRAADEAKRLQREENARKYALEQEAEDAKRRQQEENARKIDLEHRAEALEKRKLELLERQAAAAEQAAAAARKAANAAERAGAKRRSLNCSRDYTGGFYCD